MEKINHVIDIANQSHHMPVFLSMLVGLLITRKRSKTVEYIENDNCPGDNIPATLMDGLTA